MDSHQGEVDEATRHKMRSVRRSGTSPEIAVQQALESLSLEFTSNVDGKPGRPDVWLTGTNTPIFVHGCFWHRHDGCSKASTPKRNREFWLAKFRDNQERDTRVLDELRVLGYSPITVWQCETVESSRLAEILEARIETACRG